MKIGELSKVTGVSIPTIRLYEKDGLIDLADRTDGRFRVFSEKQRRRLDFIKRLRNLGFTLEDVKEVLSVSAGSEGREKLVERLREEILKRQRDLASLDKHLQSCMSGDQPFDDVERSFEVHQAIT